MNDPKLKRSRRGKSAPVAELYPPQGQWTEEDYFSLPDTNRLVELSEGALVMPPHPTYSHQTALQNLFLQLEMFVKQKQLGVVRLAPLPVRLWPGKIREPDIFFISKEHRDRIAEQACGVPDLVVEVTSPSTRRVDRGEKLFEYAKAGVGEYWLIDPEEQTIEVYVLRERAYELVDRFDSGETARSQVLAGFKVPVGEVFR